MERLRDTHVLARCVMVVSSLLVLVVYSRSPNRVHIDRVELETAEAMILLENHRTIPRYSSRTCEISFSAFRRTEPVSRLPDWYTPSDSDPE